jgi:hypothetical protein
MYMREDGAVVQLVLGGIAYAVREQTSTDGAGGGKPGTYDSIHAPACIRLGCAFYSPGSYVIMGSRHAQSYTDIVVAGLDSRCTAAITCSSSGCHLTTHTRCDPRGSFSTNSSGSTTGHDTARISKSQMRGGSRRPGTGTKN